jgi:phage gp29-like protein
MARRASLMGMMSSLAKVVATLIGVSAYNAPALPPGALTLDSPQVRAVRKAMGGQIQRRPETRIRWYVADLEAAMHSADSGDLTTAAQLCRAMRRDGVLAGVLSTRTNGIVGLPRRFSGREDIIRTLEGRDGVRSVFDALCPQSELTAMAVDGVLLGVSLGELVPVDGRSYPVLVRHDPENLSYRWTENRWYFSSAAGMIPITPGDGRWVLHVDGPRMSPWQAGLWYALGSAWIAKQHASLQKSNWEGKLANPARVAVSPQGASEAQRQSWFQKVMAWGVNTVFGMTPGYDVKLLESNGRGYEAFEKTIAQSEREYVIAIAGQLVTTDGGAGFANADIHKRIAADLIRSTAEALAYTVNTQILPSFVATHFGEEALAETAVVGWDTKPPSDMAADANAVSSFGNAVVSTNAALEPYGERVDARELAQRHGVPTQPIPVTKVATVAPANDVAPLAARTRRAA